MKNAKPIICVVTATLGAITSAQPPQTGDAVPVAAESFIAPKAIWTLA
jgi:hypothetical protein